MHPFVFKLTRRLGMLVVFTIMSPSLQAGSIAIPNSFSSGTPAVAAEVNANFSAVKTAVDDNDSRIAALEASIAALQATVTAQAATITDQDNRIAAQAATIANLQNDLSSVQNNSVLALDGKLTFVTDGNGYPTAQFSGVNVQVINGVDQTTANGVGNLIVGYNLPRPNFLTKVVCSIGAYTDQTSCEANGGIWASNHKSGSHNLVGGVKNSYSGTGGLVFGVHNVINESNSSVTGGTNNIASGIASSVSGGKDNTASGEASSVSSGFGNTASGNYSSVSGGVGNIASGVESSVSGGAGNTASGFASSVSGGGSNGIGPGNTASGSYSSVSGGKSRSATGIYDWAAGSLFEDF